MTGSENSTMTEPVTAAESGSVGCSGFLTSDAARTMSGGNESVATPMWNVHTASNEKPFTSATVMRTVSIVAAVTSVRFWVTASIAYPKAAGVARS